MILIGSWIDRVPIKALAIASALLCAAANLGLFGVRAFPIQLLCGTLAGLGFGCVFAATIAAAAASDEADRLYAIGNGGALLLIMAVMTTPAGWCGTLRRGRNFSRHRRSRAPLLNLFLRFRARHPPRPHAGCCVAYPRSAGPAVQLGGLLGRHRCTYAFSERIGRSIGLGAATIGVVLSAGVFVGVIGTAAAAYFGGRINRRRGARGRHGRQWVVVSAAGLRGQRGDLFGRRVPVLDLHHVPVLLPARHGRSTGHVRSSRTLGGGLDRLGYGSGAWIGGLLAEHAGYSVTGILGCAGCGLGLALGFPSLFRALDREPDS